MIFDFIKIISTSIARLKLPGISPQIKIDVKFRNLQFLETASLIWTKMY